MHLLGIAFYGLCGHFYLGSQKSLWSPQKVRNNINTWRFIDNAKTLNLTCCKEQEFSGV